jgi:hypothetical protein
MSEIHPFCYPQTKKCCYYLLLLFFSDCFLPLSRLIIRNPHERFRLEGRKMIFQGHSYITRSLILKKKISDKVFEVFVLFLLILNIIIIILFMFLCFIGR